MKSPGTARRKKKRVSILTFVIALSIFTGVSIFLLALRSIDPSSLAKGDTTQFLTQEITEAALGYSSFNATTNYIYNPHKKKTQNQECASVEKMGDDFRGGFKEQSLRVRRIIQEHFDVNGASRVRDLPPENFCRHKFVLGKASEAGFGNEMYKILTAAALSIMLDRSLIIGQTRKKFPFGDHISYSNISFTLEEVKHLWRQNGCATKYGRHLLMRIDDFQKPARTSILCSNWKEWEEPIIWLQNSTDAVAAQFFLKNVHIKMREVAMNLFGKPEDLHNRPNVFGELMRVLISPLEDIKLAVNSVLGDGRDPDIALHMRMLMNRSVRATQAALSCIRKAIHDMQLGSRPRLVLISDSPSAVKDIKPILEEFLEVLHFDYEHYNGNISGITYGQHNVTSRATDWGPAPRWVAFVDFFLASRAKHAVVSGAHRRVGTTYAQLVAALAAANSLVENSSASSSFSFFSSFQSSLLAEGLRNQIGWGHVWSRFAGPLSCHNQSTQCAYTPLLPAAWWDGLWQSPLPRDIRKMDAYGIQLSGLGTFDQEQLKLSCASRIKYVTKTVTLI